ncbi:molybdenum cofactor guanylyltransferase MobA [Zavarzinia sp.]|uniref:molybdenum cofactor guanylyltransferase MobA n=1 Tax=Zavarzinia sp. TaxID=2027920 RepID=UPI003BB52E1C
MKPAGIILCGGLSRRFGHGPKMLAPLAGKPLVQHVIERVAPQVGRLALNVNGDPAPYLRYGLEIVADTLPDYPGPLAGVLAGLLWAGGPLLTVTGDEPFVPRDLAGRLAAADAPIAFAASHGRDHWLSALWSPALAGDLRHALTVEKLDRVGGFVRRHAHERIDYGDEAPDPFLNINTPDDLALAEAVLAP